MNYKSRPLPFGFKKERVHLLSFFFLRRSFFENSRTRGVTNECKQDEYSGSWLFGFANRDLQKIAIGGTGLLSAFASVFWRLVIGKSYPVTAAQLLPILTEFLVSVCLT